LNSPNQRKVVNWLVTAIFATLFFGFYGLFTKLSAFQHPVVSNLVIYVTATMCGIVLASATKRKVLFSMEAFVSGISSDIAVLTMLYTLASNQLLVVFAFVSFASVVFFLIILVFEKPKLSGNQKSLAVIGILASVFGLFLASTSTAGGVSHLLRSSAFDPYFLLLAPVIPLGLGFWAYFSFVAIKKRNVKVSTAFLNYSLASLVVAVMSYPLFGMNFSLPAFSELRNFFPVIAGLLVMGGVILTFKSYEMTSGESRIEETIVVILANAEIVPLIFLSYFILKEFTIEGFIGAFTVFIGLTVLNSARAR
jgi:hypothetical protein